MIDEASRTINFPSNTELLNRIRNLEKLLSQQTGAQIPNASGRMSPAPSQPTETRQDVHGQTGQLSPVSFTSGDFSQQTFSPDRPSSRGVGVLNSAPNGNTRYEPRSAQWTSVLANTSLSIATPSLDDQEESAVSFGFPFTTSPVASMEELLSILPPTQQCDMLKNRYFCRIFTDIDSIIISLTHLTISSSSIPCMIQHFMLSTPISWNILR
ncbi:hypothetical protein BDZ45DRAFT_254302 [Acephala macrosclerotiorum]|nr:hypothetical protein BDZ45DRAFT_254302 [Acephala macrosclerotiorum]